MESKMVSKLRLTVGFALILSTMADHSSVLLSNSVSVPVSTSYNAADSHASASSSSSLYSSSDQSGSYAVEEKSQPVSNSYSTSSTETKTKENEEASVVSGTPFSGNLYYYYPVAAYPIADPITNKNSASSYGNTYVQSEDSNLSPLIYLLVPLVILIIAIPLLALLGVNVTGGAGGGGRQFLSGRSKDLDEKFGSFSDLQREIDVLLEKYVSALESYQCKDRIVCEMGVKAQGLSGKEMFFSIVGWLAPEHSILGGGRLDLLRDAATKDFTMESCQQAYECHPPAIVQEGLTKETIMSHLASSNSS